MKIVTDTTADVSEALGATVGALASGPAEGGGERPRLPGRYQDLGLIGGGSFGEVRRVHDTQLDRVVAMKLLHPHHAAMPHVRRRFFVETSITAQLQHPGIVALYDSGEQPDGRLWYTMKEVRGRTLGDVIDELHACRGPDGFGPTPSGWTFRRVIDAFARIAQALAYAHSRSIVHRDLKPANLMTGEFGEVLVMDWGLARRIEPGATEDDVGAAPAHAAYAPGMTRQGDILGTPAFMSPEQARGDTALHGPASDIYALGAVLHDILTGRPPRSGSLREVIAALLSGRQVRVSDSVEGGPPLPAELVEVCERAMRPAIEERHESAEALAADVVAWLDGVRRREQALGALDRARAIEPEIASLRREAAAREAEARSLASGVKPFDPIDKKRPAWALEDEAARLGRGAALAEARWSEAVHGALCLDPDLPEAHALLADHHRARLAEAEQAHRDEDAARAEELLRIHDRGRHAAFLRGDGALTLVTDPPGAEVHVERFVLQDRRLVPVPEGVLGVTPLRAVRLPRGSYLLRIRARGRAEVRYPVLIERDGHWDGRPPGESEAYTIHLPAEGELGENDVYVPAGWCWIGGDPAAPDSLPGRRIWIDGFVMGRFPVTTAEYIEFLNDLVARGRETEALAACPKVHLSAAEAAGEPVLQRDASGRFHVPPERASAGWRLDAPVVLIDWHAAMAYARWLEVGTGRPWRLPDELEREKATRGVDGRLLPWGDHVEPTFACVIDTSSAAAARESVSGHPTDESPCGARGMAGNTRDWCIHVWAHGGPRVEGGRLRIEPARPDDPDYRAIKGGAWTAMMMNSRAAARFGGRPSLRMQAVGIRVVRALPGG